MPVFKYGAEILQRKERELKDVDRKSRETMTMHGELHPRSDVNRLYIKRKGMLRSDECGTLR